MATTVVNRKHTSTYDVYVGRPSKWANPYKIGQMNWRAGRQMTRADVIAAYEDHLRASPDLLAALPELKDKVLACWCHPLPCHAHVLARLADALP